MCVSFCFVATRIENIHIEIARIIWYCKGGKEMPKTAKQMEKIIKKDGWYKVKSTGSHRKYKHKIKKGSVTIPFHSGDLDIKTEKSIYKQAQIGGK